jgi:Flp pilus assembly protein TadG
MTTVKQRMSQRGLSTVEFTVALPLLLFLLLAVSEFGRAFLQYTTLTHAIRHSARYVASQALRGQAGTVNLDAGLVAAARSLTVYGNTTGTGTPLLPGLVPANVTVRDLGGGNIAVNVSYAYQPMIGTAIPDLMGTGRIATTFTLTSEAVMRAIS